MGEDHELKNRRLHIGWKDSDDSDKKLHIEPHIEEGPILSVLDSKTASAKTKANIIRLYKEFGKEKIFGRADVMKTLGVAERAATSVLGKAYELALTERITGAGKGKYRFIV